MHRSIAWVPDESKVISPFLGSTFEPIHILTWAIAADNNSITAAHDIGHCIAKNVSVLLINTPPNNPSCGRSLCIASPTALSNSASNDSCS